MGHQMIVLALISVVLIGFAYAAAPATSTFASSPKVAPYAAPTNRPTHAPAPSPKSHESSGSLGPITPPFGRHHPRSPPYQSSGSDTDAGSSASDATPADAPSSGSMLKGSTAGATITIAAYFLF